MADGGACGYHPAVSVPFYHEEEPIYGELFLTRDQITEVVAEAEVTGHQVAGPAPRWPCQTRRWGPTRWLGNPRAREPGASAPDLQRGDQDDEAVGA